MTFGERIRTARKAQGLTKDELAILTGCESSTINRYEKDRASKWPYFTKRLCRALGVSSDWLFGLSEEGGVQEVGEE